jgi:hypothetical protein
MTRKKNMMVLPATFAPTKKNAVFFELQISRQERQK